MRESDEKSYKVIDLDWNLSIFFLHYDSGVLITFVEPANSFYSQTQIMLNSKQDRKIDDRLRSGRLWVRVPPWSFFIFLYRHFIE